MKRDDYDYDDNDDEEEEEKEEDDDKGDEGQDSERGNGVGTREDSYSCSVERSAGEMHRCIALALGVHPGY